MGSALFLDITQRRVVVLYRRFRTTCRSHIQGSPWIWDRQVVPKRRYRATTPRCVISKTSAGFICIAAGTWNHVIKHMIWGLQGRQFQPVFSPLRQNVACKIDNDSEKHTDCFFFRCHTVRVKKQWAMTQDALPKHWHPPTRQRGVTSQSPEQLTKQVTSRQSNEL